MHRDELHKQLLREGWKLVKGSQLIYEKGDEECYINSDWDGNVVDYYFNKKRGA